MNKFIVLIGALISLSTQLNAVTSSTTTSTTTTSKPKPAPAPEFKKPLIVIPKEQHVRQEFYANPGIVSNVHGKWVGSDHLLNVPDHIGINIEVLQPESARAEVPTDELHQRIAAIFQKAHIVAEAQARKDGPPLPFLHILIMLFPIDKGYAAYVGGRLFEEVKKRNVEISGRTALQAITWERQTLIIFPTDALNDQLTKAIDEIIASFIERYEFFEKYRPKENNND